MTYVRFWIDRTEMTGEVFDRGHNWGRVRVADGTIHTVRTAQDSYEMSSMPFESPAQPQEEPRG
jgi:hypothetical protein